MNRPKVPAKKQLAVVSIRLDADERAILKRAAKRAKLTAGRFIAAYLRTLA